jgi:hypothetical protein
MRKTQSRIYLYVLYFYLLCVVFLISMCCNFNYYVILTSSKQMRRKSWMRGRQQVESIYMCCISIYYVLYF